MFNKKLKEENLRLRIVNEKLQAEKDELLKINQNNVNEYDDLLTKYNNLLDLNNTSVPEILKREVSE